MKLHYLLIFLVLALPVAASDSTEQIAEKWIKEAPTFSFDGFNLELKNHDEIEHVLEYTFMSRHAGYGDRTDKYTAEVLTPHTIKIKIVGEEVVSAIIDGIWDEIKQEKI
ncbi:hypothetical protein HYU11_02970 [Candidatus Woesearchaeota archaeon]|nr:hypothetical protein [Candidatus Woesearchaeota archaeon]